MNPFDRVNASCDRGFAPASYNEVITVSGDQLDDMPGGGSDCVLAIAKLGERLVMLLDPAGLFAGELAAV